MSESPSRSIDPAIVPDTAPTPTRKRRPFVEYSIVLIIIGLVVAAAYFQEPISFFVSMHEWDTGGPGKVLTAFLKAGKQGDQKTADSYMGSSDYHTLTRDGKWLGYFVATPAGKLDFDFHEMAPADDTQPTKTEFVHTGQGYALVTMPDGTGKPVNYRLEMRNGGWKIIEMLGGKVGH